MPSKYQIVSEMAAREAAQISSGARSYMDFLETAASNYKYSFREQLLIHNQKPDATACAEIGTWNKLGRWVNKGTKGIALLVDNQEKYKVRYVFDVSDTNSFRGYEIYLWKLQPRFEDRVMVALEDRFGALDEHTGFSNDILTLVNAIVEDNLTDYAELLRTVKDGSLLEELDELNTDMWLRSTVKSSVAFIVLTRCGYDARQLFAEEDFSRVYDFSTLETVSVLGDASSDISEMVLREIEITVRALQREEKTQNHTFANSGRSRDNVRTITERSDEHGNDTDISAGGRLSPTQRSPAGEPEGGQIWDAAARLPARPPKADLHRDAPSRQVKQPFGDDRPAGDGDDGNADRANGESGERDGASESIGSDALGPVNEQHSEPGGGDSSSRSDLQLIDIEAAIHSGIDYFHQDAEKQELLRTCDELKGHRVEIAAFFEAHESSKERGDFIRSFFDSTFVEQILETGQRVGHRAYANCMNLWRGAYLSREAESFMHWEGIAATINGMILMRQWLDPDERQLPSQAEQLSFLQDELDENETEFVMPQEAIDYVLTGGSGVHEGKYRILEQFEKGESSEDNIKFLKAEYGVGGHSDAIPGTGIWEDHDSKGITLKRILKSDDKRDTLLLKWPRVEKRIRELIAADRYLNAAEKAEYPDYLHRREVRSERILIAKAFEEIIAEYRNSAKENGKEDVLDAKWYLSACASAFATGEKKIHVRTGEGDFILPIMREAIQAIAAEKTPLTERCEVMLNELSGPLAMGLEPTEEELNPPPPPKVEYRISLGDAVYIGSKQFEVLSLGDNVVEVSEADYPLFHKEFVRSEFDHMVAENPLNDRYRHIVEEPEIESYTPLDDDGRYTIHSMSSPGQKDEFAVFDEQTGDFVVGSDSLIHSFQTIREAYDYYRAIIADHIEEKPAEQQYEIGYGHMGNGLTVWNRLETENGDYKTVAHIDLDRKVTFYDAGLPDEIKAAILNVAQTSDMSISATQDAPVFATPAQELELGNEMWQDYNRIRGEQNGAVVLYQVGDFYEVLGEDARTVAEALDLTMTTRNVGLKERVPMCGIPAKMLETSIYLINDRSFDVVVVESTGNISVLVSTHKITPIVSRPVGRVDYLGTNGDVAYSIEYTEEQRLVRDILDDNHNGVPMSIVVYRDKDGNTISQDFIGQLDPAPQGFEVIDYKKARPETSLDRAKRLINEYSQREFESDADFSDLTSVGIAYTMTEDEDMPLEAVADLINCRINRYVNGKLVDCQEYDSLEDMIHIELEYMDFNDLVSFTDEQIAEARDRADTEDHSQLEIDKETSTENSDVQRAPFGVDARTEEFEHVELFDISMLLTEARISPDTVPVGWFCYDLRGSDYDPGKPIMVEDRVVVNHAGTVLSPVDLELDRYDDNRRSIGESLHFLGEMMTLEQFCEEHGYPLDGSAEQAPETRVDEMLKQARLAAELADQTGQMVFGFEEGTPQPINIQSKTVPVVTEAELAPPPSKAKPKGKVTPTMLYPEISSEWRMDYKITDDNIGVGTPLERYHHNVMAIQLLKKLESEHRLATPTEQSILAEYVGWGGLADCFDERNSHYLEVKQLLTEDEYIAARESTLTAFYTPPIVIRAMYQVLENMGFQRGNLLEPSCGVGNFLGMKPDSLSDSRIYGVELDSISGRIAQQLYQNSSIAVQGFEKTELPDSFFDVAIGNIPFGNFKLVDKRYDKFNFLIHDYFFAKTLDRVRPGGIIAFVTSKGTMDKESPVVRKYIAQRADLLGAIRLPNNTFKDAAGTDVTSDILFLQKRDTLTVEEPSWVHLNTDENGLKMNQYFIDNPDMVMGEMREVSGPYGPETACIPYDGQDLSEMLAEAIQNITGSITEYEFEELAEEEVDKSIPADPSVRNFSYTLVDGEVYYRENSRMVPVELSITANNRVKGLVGIRDAVRQLIEYQTEDYPDEMIEAAQRNLNRLYDEFITKYGIINSRANKSAFNSDNSFFLLSSLEVLDDEGNFIRKADMFSKRTIKQRTEITHVDTATEALAVALAEKAMVDMDYMMELTGKTEEEIFEDLKGVIFLNPMHGYGSDYRPKYLPADEYLSGNVREKLEWARRSAELYPDDYAPNVEALERVQPIDLTASEISVRLGSTWVPTEVYEEFMFDLLDTPWYMQRNIKIHFSQYTGEWNVEGKSNDRSSVKANNTYGTDRINAYKIIEQTLNLKDVRIFDYIEDENGNKKPVLNKKETAIAQAKQEQIKQAFQEWIWRDQSRRERLCRLYNEKFNSIRPREYDGSHLSLVGINPEITLRQHQLNAVARGLYGGNELLGHVVGAGKTFTMVAIAQESKRLGLCHKSLIVVPNHLTEQWAAEYLQLYPSANILVATAKDFEAKNRKRFCGRIATGEYDAIIIGHSQLEKIPLSFGRQCFYLEQQRDEIMQGIMEMKQNRGDRFSIKQLERSKKMIEAKLEKLNDQSRKDDLVTFEELGIDKLFIDEAHYYKNLAAFTKMRNVGGISQTEAQKSSDLYMKIRYLDELTGGRGVCFATGTPISNTMVEMYTMQKYLQYDTLRRNDLIHFDSWASTFGETVTAIELAPEGTGYRAKTRFSRFFNLPELLVMFKEVADIQTADMLNLPVPKANYHSVVLKPSEYQKEMVDGLAKRAEKVRSGMVNSSEDNMLVITNDGRKLALDQRLINEMLPDSETGKVTACAENVFEIWLRTREQRSTQMVFCDLSTPHNDGHFNVYDAIRDKLIARGIPAEEIAYIHSAGTEAKKKELFGKVRSGQIRVLIGSTQKMGAGTNVQKKLIALHHLDCPWRPADLQQREGRIVRQGNENPEVEIFTYVTEGTFDAYLYQLVESKQKFIGQIMTSKSPVRSAEDIDETALSYAEIKALCSGNPKIKLKMDLDVAVAKLKLLKANHLSQIYSLESDITHRYPRQISEAEQTLEGLRKDIERRDQNTQPNEDGFSPMVVEGITLTEKKAAGSAILEACKAMTNPDAVPIGQYRGFDLQLYFDKFSREYRLTLCGKLQHSISLGMDIFGNIQRIDNALDGFETRVESKKADLAHLREQLETAISEAKRPFPQEGELKDKQAQLDQLNIELNMDKPENAVIDEDRDDNEPERGRHEPIR